MSVTDVEKTLDQIKPHLNIDSWARNHETSTRYMIVDPILRAVGWDLSNPDECIVEYPIFYRWNKTQKPNYWVDYLLFDSKGNPAILVEAKNIQMDTRSEEYTDQIENYLECLPEVRVAVLTNGEFWDIRICEGEEKIQSDRLAPLGLNWENKRETASRLEEALAKRHFG